MCKGDRLIHQWGYELVRVEWMKKVIEISKIRLIEVVENDISIKETEYD